jgi:hypothetical protein
MSQATPDRDRRDEEPPEGPSLVEQEAAAAAVDAEPTTFNQRVYLGPRGIAIGLACIAYTAFHLIVMNVYPLETWTYRLIHVAGGLALGFLLFSASAVEDDGAAASRSPLSLALLGGAALGVLYGAACMAVVWIGYYVAGTIQPAPWLFETFGIPLLAGTSLAILHSWLFPDRRRGRASPTDILLAIASIAAIAYLIWHAPGLRMRAGMPMADRRHRADPRADPPPRRPRARRHRRRLHRLRLRRPLAAGHPRAPRLRGARFFAFIYTDNGILGPTGASRRPTSSSSSPSPPSCRRAGSASTSSTSPSPRRARRAAVRPRWRLRLGPDGHDQRHLGGQRRLDRLADHPAHEEGRLQAADRRRGRGRRLVGRPDHAADHGRGRLHHGRDHRHRLYRHRRRGDHPGDPLLPVGLLHGRQRGAQEGHEGPAALELPEFRKLARRPSCSSRSSS